MIVGGWRLAVGGWWLVVGGWWLVVGGWWLVVEYLILNIIKKIFGPETPDFS